MSTIVDTKVIYTKHINGYQTKLGKQSNLQIYYNDYQYPSNITNNRIHCTLKPDEYLYSSGLIQIPRFIYFIKLKSRNLQMIETDL